MMHKMILLVIGLLGLAGVGSAQIVQSGQCGTINYMQDFVLNSFATGTWYEVGKSPIQNADCSSLQIISNADGSISVSNSLVVNNFLQSDTGTATHTSGTAQLTLTLSSSATPIPFGILGSDYNNYAVAINCVNLNTTFREINVWQLGREITTFNNEVYLNAANNLLSPVGLSVSDLTSIDHSTTACTQLPVIPNGQPVILPGQCATSSIQAVQNFNVTGFTGTWHEISSYYSANAVGTCARADYTLVGATVNVVNSQVLNQQLDTITGTATLIGDDGSGRLNVILDVLGVLIPQELLVIDTDYTGYAVSYSCVNLENNQRQVNSWILSRTRQISAASQTEVNRVIASLVDLNDAYFQATDQSDDGCFYFPTYAPGVPVEFPGSCDNNVAAIPNFDLTQFIGTWHEIEAYPKVQQTGTCVNHAFSTSTTANTLNLISNQVIAQSAISASGSVTITSNDGSGRLTLTLTTSGQTITIPYWILATDYTSYALAYACENQANGNRAVYSWKLSRSQTLPAAALTPINNAIAAVQVLDQQYFETVDQTDSGCFYFPTAQPGVPVLFPGQCDSTIPVQANFDPTLYTGLWHDIESYPAPFQDGTCSNAYYTLVGGIVDVFNTQVINQQLDTINGTAIIPDPNEPAKLLVTFPVAGTIETISSEYWILSTDYTTYSIVYSCTNIPSTNQRLVFSWKLSRTKALTNAAITAINAVIDTIQVLDSRYYVPVDQTDAGCFYFPQPQTGQPVIFPGQCDDSIAAVPNFDLTQFIGIWHEIEEYPKVQQTGTCVNHAFSTSTTANTLNLVSNQVVAQSALSASGSVTITSNDGSGRLTLTLTTSDQTITIPYWILATDYTSYALAYACENQPDGNRAVYSWKLSRSQTLPAAALTPINNAIAAVQVLDQQYFETVDQTDSGCFYFPTAQPGVPVLFPGQCDSTIPVQANFDPTLYTGLWHDIESYPAPFQDGTCSNAYYTLVGGIVDVFNTQVINQQLDTINGTAIIPDPSEPAKLLVTFPVAGTTETISSEYWILSTDYTTYSIVYSCTNIPSTNQRLVFSWKLSRTKALTNAAITAINAVIETIQVLDSRYYVPVDQTDAGCFYFPQPQTGQPVIFPGQCDDSIAAVPNFDLTQFIGIWHEIEEYPKVQQTGTCVNHAFSTSTTANTLNLVSNQVVAQSALSASGSVTITSNDGSGRLTLTLTTSDQTITIPYWILATDYTSYALAYACENQPDGNRAVYSWKLSRSQTLPAAAQTAINNAIAAVQVLDQQYFETVDQTDSGCFYFPTAQPGVPVLFPGQCDSTIPVQANFDPTLYTGLWHDIESYPAPFQDGTCSNAYYTLVGGIVDVFNTQVINQQLDTINGTAIIPDPSEPAKLLVTFPVAGTTETISSEYWTLSTDYTTYSIVYSCTNIPSTNQRLVFSWKLSRTKALTDAAITAINAVINTIQVLDSRYYVPVDQTDAGCFYFPQPQAGQPVIFPGQCDDSIAAVPNFILEQFIGTWHEIEAYPKVQQTGTCVNHAFSASDTANTLNLVSNQVVDQLAIEALGSVVVDSTDGSGRLNLTLTTASQTISIPYWILATDYNNYALAYSCINLPNDRRVVNSWKLSRTQTLPAAADAPINTAIAAVDVLNQQYYENVNQTPVGCSSYPNIPAGDPIILEGLCGTVTPVTDFESAAFAGTWYETERYASERQSGSCALNQFSTATQTTFTLTQTIVYNERLTVVSGTAVWAADGVGTLTAILSDGANLNYTMTIHILATDYSGFALLYSCENVLGNNRQIFSWKLSRFQSGLTQAANDSIAQVVSNNVDLFDYYYQPTGQTSADCFYYPVFEETPDAIVLPGSCPTVTGVPNFNVNNYLGDWYDVGRYPIASQFGTCPIAGYSLVDGVISIRNTMVVDETLRVQNAIARLSSGGTGLLQVTYVQENGEETVAQYFILDTDYVSYSVLYSCSNLPDGTRRMYSWKLSRTPNPTAAVDSAINNIINSTQGLLDEYYLPQSHSDQDCFYVPEPVSGEPVLFRGACETVPGMQGFNTLQYLGWWHEIERYPSDNNAGQCTSNDFVQSSANVINVIETNVNNGVGNEITSVATLTDDGTITITRSGVPTTYTVIDTDYNSYSLLYTCEEVVINSNTYRRVWSAKHSKARTLTAAAQAAMTPIIAANPVLHQHLYENVDQSDSACFHYREDASVQVILPGQCDTSIPVQANFDITQFAGIWYQIERYPYPQVSNNATCVAARYTVNGNSVNVQNWEVLDGVLNTKEGTASVNEATLTVTLPVDDSDETVTTNLQILATDYVDYALAYTCVNINSFQRAVGAFKLSRSRQLTNDGQSAIETYTANREEFHQPHFINVWQHDDCAEPSSALLVKSSIIVMLVCVFLQLVM